MTVRRLHSIVLLLAIVFYQNGPAQEVPAVPAEAPKVQTKAELSPQLKLNKDALLNKGSTEQMRMNAVAVLLTSDESEAKNVLLEALSQKENPAARIAVCKVLGQTRTNQQPVENRAEFIEPLLQVLADNDVATARLAAEATLMFEYEQVAEPLDKIILNSSLPLQIRLNAVYALELHPDMRVAVKLLELVDDPQAGVAAAAQTALNLIGVPIGKDPNERSGIIEKLRSDGQEVYLREQLIRQKSQIIQIRVESNLWQGRYLDAQNQICDSIVDEAEKGKFLAQHLKAAETTTKLWALGKLRQLRWASKTTPKLTSEVGSALVGLVSDQAGNVRIKTAELLSSLEQVNSAERLLGQLEAETDDEVKTALFSALGWACYYAFLDTSPFKIPPETRGKALEWAAKYVLDANPTKAQKGAATLGRLLEQDGLTPAEADRYLGLLVQRYAQEKDKPDATLRGELLGAMASLCAQGAHSAQSKKLFAPLFESALADKADRVREKAVDGLRNIDKAAALGRLRKGFVDDPSSRVRSRLIDLAAEVGGKDDLSWLEKKIGSNGESEPAWQAMLKIFAGSDAGVLTEWIDKLAAQDSTTKLSNEQKVAFLETAERKIAGQNNVALLKKARNNLVALYLNMGQFEKAVACLKLLRESVAVPEQKAVLTQTLFDTYLRWQKPDLVANLVAETLQAKDMDPNNTFLKRLDEHLSKPPAGIDPNGVYTALVSIKAPQDRPQWQEWLKSWATRLGRAKAVEAPKVSGPVEPQKG